VGHPGIDLPWGRGDLISVGLAAIFVAAGLWLHRRSLTEAKVSGFFANGLTFGPLLMIAIDPINKVLGIVPIDLLRTVVFEARLTLWWAAVVAGLRVMRTLKA
jgi:hypothetical protein